MLPEALFSLLKIINLPVNLYYCVFLIFNMRYIEPTRVKVLMMMFFATGAVGVLIGLSGITPPNLKIMITLMSIINIGLGAFFTFIYLTQIQGEPDARKKKRKKKLD